MFVPFAVGAHASQLVVLDANGGQVRDYDSLSSADGDGGVFTSNTGGAYSHDVDGDGVNEVVVQYNDYEPNYAEGTVTETYWSHDGEQFVFTGCTPLVGDVTEATGPSLQPGEPGCEVE